MKKVLFSSCLAMMVALSAFGGMAFADESGSSTDPGYTDTTPATKPPGGGIIVYGPPEGGH